MNRIHPFETKTQFLRPHLQRSVNMILDELPKPHLMRQTNEHEELPHHLWLRWWTSNAEEKKNIWLEYEAMTWS